MENRVSGLEDKVDVIGRAGEDKDKRMKNCNCNMQELWDSIKRPYL
jgi:hypothetical protein